MSSPRLVLKTSSSVTYEEPPEKPIRVPVFTTSSSVSVRSYFAWLRASKELYVLANETFPQLLPA